MNYHQTKIQLEYTKGLFWLQYDEWSAIEDLHKVKVRSCTCKKCATESFIESSFCNTRIHYDCDSVNFYYRTGIVAIII